MAMMMNCAMDWTYDMFAEDMKKYTVADKNSENYVAYFIASLKESVEDYNSNWCGQHDGHQYDKYEGYVGDCFARDCRDWFSDFYKDAYGQRPHLPMWFYIKQMGLPHHEDTLRTFCASPVEDAIENAKYVRNNLD